MDIAQEALVTVGVEILDSAPMFLLQLPMPAILAHVTLGQFIPAYVRAGVGEAGDHSFRRKGHDGIKRKSCSFPADS